MANGSHGGRGYGRGRKSSRPDANRYWFEGERERNMAAIGTVLDGVFGEGSSAKLSDNQRAALAWRRANGDVEREHTTGVFLKKPRNAALAPVLGVFVDSRTRMMDFNVNREIYLSRLAAVGFEVSGIEFRLTHRPPATVGVAESVASEGPRPSRPRKVVVSDEDHARAVEATRGLPDGLREKALRAMENSLSVEREESTQND